MEEYNNPYNLPPVQPGNQSGKPKKPHQKLVAWIKSHKKASIATAVALMILIGAGITFAVINSQNKPEPTVVKKEKPKPKPAPVYYSPLTGAKVADEAATKQPVTAIMIENSPDARPQSGLKDSGVVFEAIAEGGITRFLALYQQEKPQLVGPVRSLRPYYVDWLAPFNASVAHVGGSKAALDEVRNGSYRDIDQFFNPGTYWRANDRYAPHNVYTNFEKLDALNSQKGYTSSTFEGFERKDDAPNPAPNATSITATVSSALYNSSYTYDATSNSYLRSQGGAPHNDREAGQINPKAVIVAKANMTHVMEDGYRESIQTNGSGTAYIFQDGTVVEGKWHKPSRGEQMFFTTVEGEKVKLNRGQTWITFAPEGKGGATWQ